MYGETESRFWWAKNAWVVSYSTPMHRSPFRHRYRGPARSRRLRIGCWKAHDPAIQDTQDQTPWRLLMSGEPVYPTLPYSHLSQEPCVVPLRGSKHIRRVSNVCSPHFTRKDAPCTSNRGHYSLTAWKAFPVDYPIFPIIGTSSYGRCTAPHQ